MGEKFNIGIDLGGTKIETIVLKDQLPIFRDRVPTEAEKGPDHILNQISKIYTQALDVVGSDDFTVGICTPGSIAPDTKLLRNSNTTCLNGTALHSMIEEKLNHSVKIENDANCFALAEATLGAGKGHELVFGIIMGTGCGGGFVFNNQIRLGPNLISGEWGHSVLYPDGNECYCGKRGCVETYISGGGLETQLKNYGINYSAKEFLNKKNKNGIEIKIFDEFMNNFGRSVANIVNSIDPDIIVLGGGLSNLENLYNDGIEEIQKYVFSESFKTPIVMNKLGDSAGVYGAALL
jgi:fructokinase